MKKNTKIIAAVSLLIALCAWGFVAFEIESVMNHIDQVNADKQQIVNDEGQAAATQSLRKAFFGVGEDPHIFDSYFVSATDTPTFIENIESMGQSLNLTVTIGSVTIAPASGGNDLALSLSVSGARASILRFLQLLELLPYGVSIGGVDLQAPDDGDSAAPVSTSPAAAVWRADIQLSVAAQ